MTSSPEVTSEHGMGRDLSELCQVLEISVMPTFCVSSDGHVVFANSPGADMLAREAAGLVGQPASILDPRLAEWPVFFERLRKARAITLRTEHTQTEPLVSAHAVHARFWKPFGDPLAVISLEDLHDESERRAGLKRRDAVLQVISRAASRFIADDDWDSSCNELLKDLGQATGVSRVYVFEAHYDPDNVLLFSQRYEWVAPGITAQIDNPELQNIPLEAAGYGRWQNLLSRGRLVAGQVRDFPESERELLESQSILSLAVVPIFTGSQWWGMLGLDECNAPREWGVAETEALRTMAGLFGLATERREAARQAQEKRDSMAHQARLIAMGEMASSVAHEINQPLAAVTNYCETGLAALEADAGDHAVLTRALSGAAAQAQRAGEIIRRLRSFLRKGDTTRTLVNINELIRETLDLIEHDARVRSISIEFAEAPELRAALACRVQIQQVLFNLLRNGIEAIEGAAGESSRTITVRSEQRNPHLLRISVADTGPGLKPEMAGLIFEPFKTDKPGGMGLGLSISRTIMEAHGGSLGMDDSYRDGACFHIDLPAADDDDAA